MFYDENIDECYKKLGSNYAGLNSKGAADRLKKNGKNEIKKESRSTFWKILFAQFQNFLLLLLIAAAVISLVLGEYPDFIGIFSIVTLTVMLGFIQEYRAEKSIEALEKMSAPYCKVIRDGVQKSIPTTDVVVGDILVLEEGDIVPADCRIIEESSIKINESSLTGESLPVKKTSEKIKSGLSISDQTNMCFMGTIVTYGKGKAIVTETGMNTEFGKIAKTLQETKTTETPLQIKFERLAKQLSIAVISLVTLVFLFGIFSLDTPVMQLFLFSLSLAVASVPSALPAIVTISLAMGARRLSAKNMIIKQLPAAESLGSVTVICSDKTGTITKNQMTITKIFSNNTDIDVSGTGYTPEGKFFVKNKELTDKKHIDLILKTGYLCNNAKLSKNGTQWAITGDPTEASLIVLSKKGGLEEEQIASEYTKVKELPFDSDRKLMSMIFKDKSHKTMAYVKGAPDIILRSCNKILINGKVKTLTKKDKDVILKKNHEYAELSLRVLGLAYKDVSKLKKLEIETVENDLIFLGLVGMIDPPREGVSEAIASCAQAGIKVVMITGDHPTTAKAVAKQIGLLKKDSIVLTGQELDKLSDDELLEKIDKICILARALPIQKTRIVEALQKKGHIVAMTGDGVNDAPALKKADVGIAMGISGTDVSKEVAKAILVDDNFTTIVNAISEGRNIYDKIIKSTKYLLSCNMGEIVSVMLAIILRLPLPMVPLQILLMNLLTDGVPALGLGSEPAESDVMSRSPRNPKENPINSQMLTLILLFGLFMGLGTVAVFYMYVNDYSLKYAQTMAFTTLVMIEMFAVISVRSFKPFKKLNLLSNKWLMLGIMFSVTLQVLVIYLDPLQSIFGTVAIGLNDWLIILGVSAIGFLLMELGKIFIKSTDPANMTHYESKTAKV